ncbi:MAG TPA: nuclear transport factor 2 family protein [Gemmatimonadaceae bacterium]|nr:nuclear transport factor 2 family protein [Gemmatimonadaceae bacterium]
MTASPQTPPPIATDAYTAVRDLNEQYIDAVRAQDAGWFEDHMSDDVVVVLGDGTRLDKAGFVAAMRETPKSYARIAARDVTVRVFGECVQVDADSHWELRDGSRGVSRYIDTYIWMRGRWQVISAQITWLPQR